MKKILLILVLCLSTIGLAGCGNKLPDKVELTPENNYTAIVGQDLREGKEYYIVVEDYNLDDYSVEGLNEDAKKSVKNDTTSTLLFFRINDKNPPIQITRGDLTDANNKMFKERINVTTNDKISYNPHLDSEHQSLASVLGNNAKIFIVSE